MSCEFWRERIDAALDDGKEPDALLTEHLGDCPECRRYLADARRANDALRRGLAGDLFSPPPGQEERIFRALRDARKPPASVDSSVRQIILMRKPVLAALAAAAAAVLLWLALGGGLWNDGTTQPDPKAPALAQDPVRVEEPGVVVAIPADSEEETDPFLLAETALAYGPRVEAVRLQEDLAGVGAFLQAAFPIPSQVE